MIASPEGSKFY